MFADLQIPVMFGAGTDAWAVNPDGSINVKTPLANATSVVFDYVPYGDLYGYQLWIDPDGHSEIKANGSYSVSNITNGLCTVTVPLVTVTSDMVGCKCYLRVVK